MAHEYLYVILAPEAAEMNAPALVTAQPPQSQLTTDLAVAVRQQDRDW